MKRGFTILIADRNPHVRQYLRREMISDGYRVRLAKNGQEVLKTLSDREPPDLLILDLDLPDVTDLTILQQVRESHPSLPVVVHTLSSEHLNHPAMLSVNAFVEKDGASIEGLKRAVMDALRPTS